VVGEQQQVLPEDLDSSPKAQLLPALPQKEAGNLHSAERGLLHRSGWEEKETEVYGLGGNSA
jgi:hypothetical protein